MSRFVLNNDCFKKHTPSVFVVCSPFQALCALAAINQLEISDFKIIVHYLYGDPRNQQLENFLRYTNKDYEICNSKKHLSKLFHMYDRIVALKRRNSRYKRLFIGDFRNYDLLLIGCKYVEDNSSIVHLDDGNITIPYLMGYTHLNISWHFKILLKMLYRRRCLSPFKNLLTIYSDIPCTFFNVANLDLSKLLESSNTVGINNRCVYVVGTNAGSYCSSLDYSLESFLMKHDELLARLKNEYPDVPIIYIPHGRETKNYAQISCEKYGCEYRKVDVMVELEIIRQKFPPLAVYGFTSSALFNLKKMYPHTRVVNVIYDGNPDATDYRAFKTISEYYQRNGVELLLDTLM